ncbi:30S ribosomal protein S7 [Candidatus Woesearchaeota archaeon]|nr:30S ribosomal protein S7 [Candidatus Woesearchaeota archaeon]
MSEQSAEAVVEEPKEQKASGIRMFGKWPVDGIAVKDAGLISYITIKPVIVPRTGARYAKQRFYKSKITIVERLINKLMVPGHRGKKHTISSYTINGKAAQAYRTVEKVLTALEQKTKQNPVKVLVEAVENAAPREEIVSIEYGGARYPKAVDCAPQRRVDIALKQFVQGSMAKSFNNKKTFTEALTDEISNAFYRSPNSQAISKKLELERQAEASR